MWWNRKYEKQTVLHGRVDESSNRQGRVGQVRIVVSIFVKSWNDLVIHIPYNQASKFPVGKLVKITLETEEGVAP